VRRWVDTPGIRESIESFRAENVEPTKTIPLGSELYKFNTTTSRFKTVCKNASKIDKAFDPSQLYVLNSDGLRSDEFTSKHDGKHVLFAGCSVTAGEGLLLEHTWAYKVYQELAQTEKLSGYFNIAFPGASIAEIISQIFRYINLYGNPSTIFVNFPDPDREYYYASAMDFRKSDSVHGIDDPMKLVDTKQIDSLVFALYLALNVYCRAQGVTLIATTWASLEWRTDLEHYSGDVRESLLGLDLTNQESAIEAHCQNYELEYKHSKYKKFFRDALDEDHQGLAIHDYYSKYFMNRYHDSRDAEIGF
jgi:hypothetical protein